MKGKKIIICFIVILTLVLPVLVACNDDSETESKTQTSADGETDFPLETQTFDTTIRILCVEAGRHSYGEMQFVPDEEEVGNSVNDAVKRRNDLIEQNYGISIETVPAQYPGDEIRVSIESGSDDYQLVNDSVDRMLPRATQSYYWSLEDRLLLDSPWWDQNALDNLSITDKTYFVAGDALITDDNHTYLILFNKKMYNENGDLHGHYGDMYEFVNDGKWTYEVMYEMGKKVSKPDDNGQWGTEGGTYGLIGEGYGTNILVSGSGSASAVKTGDGNIQLMVDSEKSINAFEKVFNMMTDKANTIRVEQFSEGGWGIVSNMFMTGKGLFYCTSAREIHNIKNNASESKVDFGVIPIPKYNEQQEKYYNGVNAYQSTVLAIPVTNHEKLDATLYLLEALGYWSRNTPSESVTDAYYERTLKLQSVDAQEDADMLDLVFNNRLYDIGSIYNWGEELIGIYSRVMRSGSNTLISTYESVKEKIQADMEQTIAEYQNIPT